MKEWEESTGREINHCGILVVDLRFCVTVQCPSLNKETGTLLALWVQLTQEKGMVRHYLKLELPTAHMAYSRAWRKPGSQQQHKP